jgi:hypothetical protein
MIVGVRVARWYIYKPKIPIWVNFCGPWNGKVWYCIFYGHLEYTYCGHLAI